MSEENKPADTGAQAVQAKPRKKRKFLKIIFYLFLGLVALRLLLGIPMRIPRGPEDSARLIFPPKPLVYNGPGELHAYVGAQIPLGGAAMKFDRFKSEVLGRERDILVRLPEGFQDAKRPMPLVVVFHGYLDRPHHVAVPFIDAFDEAQKSGTLPPVVLAFPDVSIGGTGEDDPKTPNLDERLGSWGVNSNLGRYGDYLVEELLPWLRKTYNAGLDARSTALAGYSAGGFIAANLTLRHSDLADSTICVSGTVDARYSIKGSHLTPYNPKGYKPVSEDWPNRPMLRAGVFGTYTDRWAFWPVFDSDKQPGPVWQKDIPVWQRLRAENPTDLARKPDLSLRGRAFYLVAGNRDNYNFQSHIPQFTEALRARGAEVDPTDPVRAGSHTLEFLRQQLPDIAAWLGPRFAASNGGNATTNFPAADPSGQADSPDKQAEENTAN